MLDAEDVLVTRGVADLAMVGDPAETVDTGKASRATSPVVQADLRRGVILANR